LRGAIVFLAVFFIVLAVTLAYPELPPGKMIYEAVVGAETDYEVLGMPATQLISAVFNGVIYGFIAWLIFWLAEKAGLIPKREKKQQ
jgi:hypothetical protein